MHVYRKQIITKIHLLISIIVVVPAAIIYGFYPNLFLEIEVSSVDLANLLKAVMGIYFAFALLWLLGLLRKDLFKIALFSNMVFMLGLGTGRCFSIVIDGMPSFAFIIGIAGELTLGFYGLWVIIANNEKTDSDSSYIKNQ